MEHDGIFGNIFSPVTMLRSAEQYQEDQRRAADLREDIASRQEDVKMWESDVAFIDAELPKMERERLEKKRDIAIAKLEIIELREKLAQIMKTAQNGGQQ